MLWLRRGWVLSGRLARLRVELRARPGRRVWLVGRGDDVLTPEGNWHNMCLLESLTDEYGFEYLAWGSSAKVGQRLNRSNAEIDCRKHTRPDAGGSNELEAIDFLKLDIDGYGPRQNTPRPLRHMKANLTMWCEIQYASVSRRSVRPKGTCHEPWHM